MINKKVPKVQLLRKCDFILADVLTSKFKGKFFHRQTVARLCAEASVLIVRRCREEISLAYHFVPSLSVLRTSLRDHLDPEINIICQTETTGRFLKTINCVDF